MKIDPNHLHMLAAIIDTGGLGEGASALNKSQPSVSRTVAMLERRLGSRLFEKGKRPLRATELCHSLAEQGRVIGARPVRLESPARRFLLTASYQI
jgi:DNA-binding transcriptional LysR family regulator